MKTICVYCGSSDKVHPEYLAGARQLGAAIAQRGLQLWFGAGSTGLMGAVANGALQAGGEVIGVIPEMFNTPQLCHTGLTRLEVVSTMHVRKARLAEAADAFIALPGGYGTFEELFEMLTWAQIGLHRKPIGVLNLRGYYDPLLQMVEQARQEGFIYAEHLALFNAADRPEQLLDRLTNYQPPAGLERWVTREE
ncbi:MAG: TIGR00730 family Rossman fold protein [Chloroflexota bacterium]